MLSDLSHTVCYSFLRMQSAAADLDRVEAAQAGLEEIGEWLTEAGWREQLAAAVACLFQTDSRQCQSLLWDAFDRGSWVTPQLALCACLLGGLDEGKKRLLLRCPTRTDHLEGTDPAWRHVVHGNANLDRFNLKGMAALIYMVSRTAEGRDWLVSHLPLSEAVLALKVECWDHGHDIAKSCMRGLADYLQARGRKLPDWMTQDYSGDLLELLGLSQAHPVVRQMCGGSSSWRLYQLFNPFVVRGFNSFQLEGDFRSGRLWGRAVEGNQLLLELPFPYLIPWLRNDLLADMRGRIYLTPHGDEPSGLQTEVVGQKIEIKVLTDVDLSEPSLRIVETRLEECSAQLWVVGVDAECRLNGGVAASVRLAAGESMVRSLEEGMLVGGRAPGSVIFTPPFELRERGVREIALVVTLPAPTLDELGRALERVLHQAQTRYQTVALPALGCGAAGLRAQDVAPKLVEVMARYRNDLRITLSLPREADRRYFLAAARSHGLIKGY